MIGPWRASAFTPARAAPSGPFTFTLAVEAAAPVVLLRAALDPYQRLEDRRWVGTSVDLAPWAGQRITLAFSITAPAEPPRPAEIAGWGEPRLVGR